MDYSKEEMNFWIAYISKDYVKNQKANQFVKIPVSVSYDQICKFYIYCSNIYKENFDNDEYVIKELSIKHFSLILKEMYGYKILSQAYKKDMENNNRIKIINTEDLGQRNPYLKKEINGLDNFLFRFSRSNRRIEIVESPDQNLLSLKAADLPEEKLIIDAIIKTEKMLDEKDISHYYHNYKGNLVTLKSNEKDPNKNSMIMLINHIKNHDYYDTNMGYLSEKMNYVMDLISQRKNITLDAINLKDICNLLCLCYGYKIVEKEIMEKYSTYEWVYGRNIFKTFEVGEMVKANKNVPRGFQEKIEVDNIEEILDKWEKI